MFSSLPTSKGFHEMKTCLGESERVTLTKPLNVPTVTFNETRDLNVEIWV